MSFIVVSSVSGVIARYVFADDYDACVSFGKPHGLEA